MFLPQLKAPLTKVVLCVFCVYVCSCLFEKKMLKEKAVGQDLKEGHQAVSWLLGSSGMHVGSGGFHASSS